MITVRDLTYTYPAASAPTVHAMSFEVAKGEVFGFLGPSGAGKSTTQNILIGLLKGWSGAIDVLGKPLADWRRDYYRHIGVSFELPNHYLKLTARENLAYFAALHDTPTDSPEEAMARVGLADHLDKPVSDFSKGMKNRLTLARSLMHRPDLWFLDEPTAGLDPVNVQNVCAIVRERQAAGVTTILTTHDMAIADALCDRVAFIVDGRIVTCDSPDALKRAYGRREVAIHHGAEEAPEEATFPLDGLADNADFQALLRNAHIVSMHSQETTLADVFVQVTGKVLA